MQTVLRSSFDIPNGHPKAAVAMTNRVHPAVEEALDTVPLPNVARRRLLSGAGLASASLAASALLAACSKNQSSGGAGDFTSTPKWKFTFVNHVTTNPFFVPTQYGMQDAAALLGLAKPQWTGSENSNVGEMVSATNTAISAKADGIAIAVVDLKAFTDPVDNALSAGIPVVSYNADGSATDPGTARLGYVGQDLFTSGTELGKRIVASVDSGDVVGFIATPGSLNIQPRIDGAKQAIQQSGKSIKFAQVASGATVQDELSTIDAYVQGHPNLKGIFAVDAGSTQSVAQTVAKYKLKQKNVACGGFDLVPETLNAIKAGNLDFTIDQQPYLQGFLPVLYLYLFKLAGGLQQPPNTNTGLLFVTKDNVKPYLSTKTRFEGSSTKQQLVARSGAIKGTA
jgi:simple sugar transport system substrate-binding protein